MHTDTTPKEKPTGSANNPAGHTDSQIVPNPAGAGNDFANLKARFALAGHTFTRSNAADGAGMYYAARWGMGRALPDLQAAAHFLAQIGGGNV
ncbi:MAG: hypothetical protein Q7T78_01540 [Rhodoferax sp.]|nr:hypothetical protein [Rhodoferax sp.]